MSQARGFCNATFAWGVACCDAFSRTNYSERPSQAATRCNPNMVPANYLFASNAVNGGLSSYGPEFVDLFRRARE